MADRYRTFAELASVNREGIEYRTRFVDRTTPFLIMAPHAGVIEPTTGEVAQAVAGNDYSFYCFEALTSGLHITSTNFDEPKALDLAAKAEIIVAIHGRLDRDDPISVWLGGLNIALRNTISEELGKSGFHATVEGHPLTGESPVNICNRSKQSGVQVEIPRTLRDTLSIDPSQMAQFAEAIRRALRTTDVRDGRLAKSLAQAKAGHFVEGTAREAINGAFDAARKVRS